MDILTEWTKTDLKLEGKARQMAEARQPYPKVRVVGTYLVKRVGNSPRPFFIVQDAKTDAVTELDVVRFLAKYYEPAGAMSEADLSDTASLERVFNGGIMAATKFVQEKILGLTVILCHIYNIHCILLLTYTFLFCSENSRLRKVMLKGKLHNRLDIAIDIHVVVNVRCGKLL